MKQQSTASISTFLSPSEPARLESLESRRLLNGVGLDSSFGGVGSALFPIAGDQYIFAVKVLPDGSSLLAGRVDNGGEGDVLLVKVKADGTLDSSFGAGGVVVQDLGTTADSANAIDVDSKGKIIIAGQVDGATYDFVAARFNANGSLDNSFGTNGFTRVDFNGEFDIGVGLALTSNSIVIVGKTIVGGKVAPAVATLDSDGAFVSQFTLNLFANGDLSASCLAVKSDGTLLIGATATDYNTWESDFAVIFVQPNGSGASLKLINFATDDILQSIAVGSDGACYVAGISGSDFAVAKLNPAGNLDASFGVGGKVAIDFAGGYDQANAIKVLPDGSILVAGQAMINDQSDFAVVRLTEAGAKDNTFGTGGLMTKDFGNADESAMAIGVEGSKIIIAGRSYGQDSDVAAMALKLEPMAPHHNTLEVSITGTPSLVRGQEGAFVATSNKENVTYTWLFPDGSSANGASVKHLFKAAGQFKVTVVATDSSGDSAEASYDVEGDPVAIQTDENGKTNLVVGGTENNDMIYFTYSWWKWNRGLYAYVNGQKFGPFNITGHIIAYGQEGDDLIAMQDPMPYAGEFYGGAGNDLLKGSCKADTLIGGDGYDWVIKGWSKKDVVEGEFTRNLFCFRWWHKHGWC